MNRFIAVAAALVMTAGPVHAQDPLKVASKNYSVVLENDQVRVLRGILAPGDKTPLHEHPATVVVPLSDATGRFMGADGKGEERKMTAGTPLYIPADKHGVENIGKNRVEVIIVELKGKR